MVVSITEKHMRSDDAKPARQEADPADLADRPASNAVDPSEASKVKGGTTSPRDPATGLPTGKRS